MDGQVTSQRDGGVLTLTFDRTAKKNALNLAMYTSAVEALAQARKDDSIRCVVLTGAGGNFTAGNDLGDFLSRPILDESSPAVALLQTVVDFEKPIVAAVPGLAVGIGTTLLLHCDLVLAGASAKFLTPFVNLGVVPEGASSLLLPARAGFARASHLLLLAEPFDAKTALEAGIVSEIVPDAELSARALARAQTLASKPPKALIAAKKLLRDPLRAQIHEALLREGKVFSALLVGDEARAAIAGVLTKK